MKRRLVSLLLTVCLMVGLCIPAWATQVTTKDNGSVQTTVTGTVAEPQIKVTLPTTLAFSIDPTIDASTGNGLQQVTSGNEFKVLNNSAVPVYLSVTSCDATGVELRYSKYGIDNTTNGILFAIYPNGSEPNFNTSGSSCVDAGTIYGLMANYDRVCITPNGSPIPIITATDISKGTPFYLAARVGDAFQLDPKSTFSIAVTFVVSSKYIAPVYDRSGGIEPE